MLFKKPQITLIVFLFFIIGSLGVCAQAQKDVEGSKDHPMISRYKGSYIIGYEQADFNQLVLPVGHYEGDETKTVSPEGKITRILYAGPRGRSSLEVQRNYKLALENAGFEILYSCSQDCQRFPDIFYGEGQKLDDRGDLSRFSILYDRSKNQRYLLARLRGPEGAMYASVFSVKCTGNYYGQKEKEEIENRPVTLLQIIEEKSMETGKVTVNADEMMKGLNKYGKVSLYGIYFDTNKAEIKNKSETTLSEISTLLEDNPQLNLFVVGHTDATGNFEHNIKLSEKRAKAVSDYLINKEGVDSERLEPYGVGCLAPVASNSDKSGRARNRRVELVKKME